jgi:hypothetical protein
MRTNTQLAQALVNVGFVKVADTKIKTAVQPAPEHDDKPQWDLLSQHEKEYYINCMQK